MSDAVGVDPVDPWSEVVGQPVAVGQLRAAARSPVHAYLLVGPEGSGRRAAARAFAADLLAEGLDAAAADRARRLALAEAHPSLQVVERSGPFITTDDARSVVRRAAMRPPEGSRQVFLLVDFHLVRDAAPILLKAIEEPPAGTFFVVLADRIPPELSTIASRCVQVDFHPVPEADLARRLVDDGVDPDVAAVAASSAAGSLTRARLLAQDPEVANRRQAWATAPIRLDGTGATAAAVVDELLGSIEAVLVPLAELQERERAELVARAEEVGAELRKGDLKDVDDRHRREQRRVRTDELRAGLAVLVGAYRDALAAGAVPAEEFLAAADAVQALCDGLAFNPNEGLQLRALFASLPALEQSLRPSRAPA